MNSRSNGPSRILGGLGEGCMDSYSDNGDINARKPNCADRLY